jgi:hypothetical protein
MDFVHDIIVVGSGMAGAHSAQTLVEAGLKVCMLDVGFKDNYYNKITPKEDFITIRENEKNQHELFLGKHFESIQTGKVKIGAQLTPGRYHLIKDIDKYLPVKSDTFSPYESLAYGGLGSGWGAGAFTFSDLELNAMGLDKSEIKSAYNVINSRIGISGDRDDGSPFCNEKLESLQLPVNLDSNNSLLFQKYQLNRSKINKLGVYVGRSNLAVITEDFKGREKLKYREMSFYDDIGESVYRPWITINALLKKSNFKYESEILVTTYLEKENYVEVYSTNTITNEKKIFKCKKLVLASGVLGTARIVLRAANSNECLPLLCNPYTYLPAMNLARVAKPIENQKTSLSQLFMFYDKYNNNMDVSTCSFYSYRSLLSFRIIKEMPLAMRDSRLLTRYLLPSLTIVGIHHPEKISNSKYLFLEKDDSQINGDLLRINYKLSDEEITENKSRERVIVRGLFKLGLIPLAKQTTEMGASIHYCGTLPFSDREKPFSLYSDGKLMGSQNVYVADSSGFKYLPSKGITLTLMANAHNVAYKIIEKRGFES